VDTLALDTALGLLTRPSLHRQDVGDGGFRWITEDPLLLQLTVEIANSSAAPTFKASSGTPLPIAAAAFDLLSTIVEETTEAYWRTYPKHRVMAYGTLAKMMSAWCIAARLDPDELRRATAALGGYVSAIRGMLNPVRRWDIRGTCPRCKNRFVRVIDEDGHTIRRNTISILWEGGLPTSMECEGCGRIATGPDEIREYARLISETEE
jgi:hypothetical protein